MPPRALRILSFSLSLRELTLRRDNERTHSFETLKIPKQRAPLAALNGNSEVVAVATTASTVAVAHSKLSSSAPSFAPAQLTEVRENRARSPCTPVTREKDTNRERFTEEEEAKGENANGASILSKQKSKKRPRLLFPLSLSHSLSPSLFPTSNRSSSSSSNRRRYRKRPCSRRSPGERRTASPRKQLLPLLFPLLSFLTRRSREAPPCHRSRPRPRSPPSRPRDCSSTASSSTPRAS